MSRAKIKRHQTTPAFSADRPIKSERQDLLSRAGFAQQLAASVRGISRSDSVVIALYGGWGSGKTSVKNLVLENLRSKKSTCPAIVEFSPWQISGTGALPAAFFRELNIAVRGNSGRDVGRAKKLAAYEKGLALAGTVVSPIGQVAALINPIAGAAISATGTALKRSASAVKAGADAASAKEEAKSLAGIKAELAKSLASLTRPILIVIDDIDRLTSDEIRQVFQLVKANADFPNTIYLLLFERSIVARALDEISGDRGHQFLQKIVQVEFHLPYPLRSSIEKLLFAGLEQVLRGDMIMKQFQQRRWANLYADGLNSYFQNLRHVYRFLGSFSFQVAQFKSGETFEVNPVDLIALEVLRVFEPELYERLPSSKRILTRDTGGEMFWQVKQEEIESRINQLLANVAEPRRGEAREILEGIFPISSSYDSDRSISSNKEQWLRERRVCHRDLFDKYFTFTVAENDLSQAELERLKSFTNERAAFLRECQALLQRGLLELAFKRLDAYKQEIPVQNMPALITALCDLVDDVPEPEPGALLHFGPDTYALRLVYFGLVRETDEARRIAVMRDAFQQTQGLVLPMRLIASEVRTAERINQGHEFLLPESSLSELKSIWIARLKSQLDSERLGNSPNLKHFLLMWSNWGDKDEVKSWIAGRVQHAKGPLWLLKTLLAKVTSSGHEGTEILWYIHLGFVEQFFPVVKLQEMTADVDLASLQGADKTALSEFRKALKRKTAGKPYDWRPGMAGPAEE